VCPAQAKGWRVLMGVLVAESDLPGSLAKLQRHKQGLSEARICPPGR
jgi:hypothetical protein